MDTNTARILKVLESKMVAASTDSMLRVAELLLVNLYGSEGTVIGEDEEAGEVSEAMISDDLVNRVQLAKGARTEHEAVGIVIFEMVEERVTDITAGSVPIFSRFDAVALALGYFALEGVA